MKDSCPHITFAAKMRKTFNDLIDRRRTFLSQQNKKMNALHTELFQLQYDGRISPLQYENLKYDFEYKCNLMRVHQK